MSDACGANREPPVVVGVDASPGSGNAVEWAVAQAVRRGADLCLVHAQGVGAGPEAVSLARAVLAVHRRAAAAKAPGLRIHVSAVDGSPAEALVEVSRGAGMLVLGSAGRADVSHAAIGSVAARVAVHAHCPVAVVHRRPPPVRHGRIVVGVAGGAAGREALDVAACEALAVGSSLIVVHGRGPCRDSGRLEAAVHDLAERCPGIDVEFRQEVTDAATALVAAARDADLVVLGCHHVDDSDRFDARMGSVPAAVLPRARCPVLLVGSGALVTG